MFKRLLYRFKILKKLNTFASGVRKYFVLLMVISAVSLVISVITPQFYKIFIDKVIIARDIKFFPKVAFLYAGSFAVTAILSLLELYSKNKLVNKVMFRLRHKLLSNYLNFSFKEFEKRSTGDLKMRIEDDTSKLSDFADAETVDYLKAFITFIVSTIMIFSIEWHLALFAIIVIPVTFYIDHIISLREKNLFDINRGNDEKWNSWLLTSIQGWKEIKALNLEKNQLKTFVRYSHNFAEFNGRWINYWVFRRLIVPKIKDEFLMKFSLYFFGGILVMNGKITIGALLVFTMYYDLLSENLRTVSSTDAGLQSNKPFYDRVFIELENAKSHAPKNLLLGEANGEISMNNVCFSYDENLPPVLTNYNLSIKKGERLAIVGQSGSGKSTILKLLTGMLFPNSGEILYSGTDISKLNERDLYRKMGIVMQQNLLFNTSIRENLKLASPHADETMLDEACKKACIYDFICNQPDKYDTIIGERGVKLSGGQKQRLILARLFLRNVDIMIFDEATSAVDQYSENIIHHALQAVKKDTTIIIVTHRQSSLKLCDRVIRV